MNSPFYQPARQSFSFSQNMQQPQQQGGFGVQTAGTFGGFQPQQQSFGFGGGQGFGGFQPQQSFGGFGGFNPFQGGYGGFQPQQQFNPYQGGFGGFGGFGGGYNPMFGGIGGLGFNPMMGPQFGMPMGGFNPYQIQMMDKQRQFEQQQFQPQQNFPSMDTRYRSGQEAPGFSSPWMPTITETPGFGDWQQKQQQWADQTPEGTAFKNANEALEAFKKANPNSSSYSGYWADPALKAQYDKIYGDYQSGTQQYFNKLNEYEKTNPFSPSAQQPGDVQHFGLWGGTGEYDPKTGQIDLGRPRSPTAQQPQSPFTGPQRSAKDILSMAVGNMPKDMQYDLNKDGKITSADALAYQRQYGQQPQQRSAQDVLSTLDSGINRGVDNMSVGPGFGSRQPLYGGIGGLGFNPMMGPQFGMPLTPEQKYQQAQQFGTQSYLHRPEVRRANEDYSLRMIEAALAARG